MVEPEGTAASASPLQTSRQLASQLRFDESLRVCAAALATDPHDTPLWLQRAVVARGLGDANAVCESLQRALALDAASIRGMSEWLRWLQEQPGARAGLLALLRAWTARVADDAFAWHVLGMTLLTAPGFRRNSDDCLEAAEALRRAQAIDPLVVATQSLSLSGALEMSRQWAEAEAVLRALLVHEPQNAPAWNNLSSALRHTGRSEEALGAARKALAWPPARSAVTLALLDVQDFEAATQFLEQTLAMQPSDHNARLMLGELQLRRGDWADGWRNLQARFELAGLGEAYRHFGRDGATPWRGERLEGKRLVVWMEQGFGDSILFARFLPTLCERVQREGGWLGLSVFEPLRSLLRPIVPAHVMLDADRAEAVDFHLPLMNLPSALALHAHAHSGEAYLGAAPELRAVRARRVTAAAGPRRRVGLVWKGQPEHVRDPFRSMPLTALAPLLGLHDTAFFVLDPSRRETPRATGDRSEVFDWTAGLRDFSDTAALVAALDVVVTVDTAVAHLAGAVGVPTFMMIDRLGAWLWRDDAQATPWYRSIRIFRQRTMCDWTEVVDAVRDQVAALSPRAASHAGE